MLSRPSCEDASCLLMLAVGLACIAACYQSTTSQTSTGGHPAPNGSVSGTRADPGEPLVFQSLELIRRNWEDHGTSVHIDSEARFVVSAHFLGRDKTVRSGELTPEQMRSLLSAIQSAEFQSLPDEYTGARKTETEWWGYQLTVTTQQGTKTVRFHSEDGGVPRALDHLVEVVTEITR